MATQTIPQARIRGPRWLAFDHDTHELIRIARSELWCRYNAALVGANVVHIPAGLAQFYARQGVATDDNTLASLAAEARVSRDFIRKRLLRMTAEAEGGRSVVLADPPAQAVDSADGEARMN